MKKLVKFTEYNGIDYLGHNMVLCDNKDEAEFELVLNGDDKIVKDERGVCLIRQGSTYVQQTKMSSFKGVNFVFDGYPGPGEKSSVQLKLIAIS